VNESKGWIACFQNLVDVDASFSIDRHSKVAMYSEQRMFFSHFIR